MEAVWIDPASQPVRFTFTDGNCCKHDRTRSVVVPSVLFTSTVYSETVNLAQNLYDVRYT